MPCRSGSTAGKLFQDSYKLSRLMLFKSSKRSIIELKTERAKVQLDNANLTKETLKGKLAKTDTAIDVVKELLQDTPAQVKVLEGQLESAKVANKKVASILKEQRKITDEIVKVARRLVQELRIATTT